MCTIIISENSTVKKPLPNCCQACSCATGCTELGNCCPDFYIAHLINGNNWRAKSYTIADLSDRLQNQNLTFHDIELLSRNTGASDMHGTNLSCVSCKAKKKDFHLEEDEHPLAYKMVTTCPEDFKGTDDIKIKCITDIEAKPFEINDIGPDQVVPVTSLKTNYTYRNEYCLLCNEGNAAFDDILPWKVIFTSFTAYDMLSIDEPLRFAKIYDVIPGHICI